MPPEEKSEQNEILQKKKCEMRPYNTSSLQYIFIRVRMCKKINTKNSAALNHFDLSIRMNRLGNVRLELIYWHDHNNIRWCIFPLLISSDRLLNAMHAHDPHESHTSMPLKQTVALDRLPWICSLVAVVVFFPSTFWFGNKFYSPHWIPKSKQLK